MTVAPSGILTDARGPTALMRDPLTTTTASGSDGLPFPSITAQPTMSTVALCELGAPVVTRLTISASPSLPNDFSIDIDILRTDIISWRTVIVLYSLSNDWTELAAVGFTIVGCLASR